MTTKNEALRMALTNLLVATKHLGVCPGTVQAAAEALAQPEQEPVACIGMIDEEHFADVCRKANGNSNTPLYTSPPKREWVGLTDEERAECWSSSAKQSAINIEAKLKEKNFD